MYGIIAGHKNEVIYTKQPTYERSDKGKFILNNDISQKDLGYLFEVISHPAIYKVNDKTEKPTKKRRK